MQYPFILTDANPPLKAYNQHCPTDSDQRFGPLDECFPDFTLLFEQSILSSVPSLVLLLWTPWAIRCLLREKTKVVHNVVWTSKMSLAGLLIIFQLVLVLFWSMNISPRTIITIPSGLLGVLSASALVPLLHLDHTKSIRPSSTLTFYLLCSVLLDLPQLRTLYLRGHSPAILSLLALVLATRAILFALQCQSKRSYLRPEYQSLSPESTSGIVNRSLLWWLNGLFMLGNQDSLNSDTLYPLDNELSAEVLGNKVCAAWDSRSRPEWRMSFVIALMRSFTPQLAYVLFPRSLQIAFTFSQPFLISRILELLYEPDSETSKYTGYGLVLATAFIYTGIAISTLHSDQNLFRFITMFRGATVFLLYKQSLLLDENSIENSGAVSLMSTDVDRISFCLEEMHECWSRFIEVCIGIALLTGQLGWVSVVPLIVVSISTGGSSVVTNVRGSREKSWAAATEQRITMTSSILHEMKGIKMTGLGEKTSDLLQEERQKETNKMESRAWVIVWMNVIANAPVVLAPAATFAVYAIQARLLGHNYLDTVKTFTSLALIALVSYPVSRLLCAIPNTASSVGSFDRIQEFLLSAESTKARSIQIPSSTHSPSSTDTESTLSSTTLHDQISNGLNMDIIVEVKGASIAANPKGGAVLRDVKMSVHRGSIVMIVGPVGSGKSTLLRSFLNATCLSGSISVFVQSIGYCSQAPWLVHGTIKENICGTSRSSLIDEDWYHAIVEACALLSDFSALPHGDNTVVGSRGTTLSGGQRHRIALARALYHRPKLFLLDNVLDSLDQTTENAIVERLFGSKGLFKQHDFAVLLSSHSTRHSSLADSIIVICPNGTVTQDTPEHLMGQGLLSENFLDDNRVEDETEARDYKGFEDDDLYASENEKQDLIQVGHLSDYRYYMKVVGGRNFFFFVAFVTLHVFSSSFSSIWLKMWSDIGGAHLALFISIYFLLSFGYSLGNGGYAWAVAVKIAPSTGRQLHRVLLRTVMNAPMEFFTNTETGSILSRFSQDMTIIESQLAHGLLATVSNGVAALAEAALIATGSVYVVLTVPITMIALYSVQKVYVKTSRQLRVLELEVRGPVYSHFLETLEGLPTIRAFGWEKQFIDENIRRLDDSQRPYYFMFCIQRWLALVLDLMVAGLATVVVALATTLRSSTSPGLLGVSLNAVLSFNQTISAFLTGWTILETSLGAIVRLRDLEASVKPEQEPEKVTIPPPNWPSQGLIDIQNISASYNGTTPVLNNVTLKIIASQRIAICGRTGSGKSSLLSTILRILPTSRGTISIDGVSIASLPLSTLRRRIVTIPQDPVLLPGTMRLNVDPFGYSSDNQIIAALEQFKLWHILEPRGGLDAFLNATELSKGQSQMLVLTRAVLQRRTQATALVLMDESMSSIDSEMEKLIDDVLEREFQGCTVVTVAHRVETILKAEVVVVMEKGTIVEVGEPRELMKCDGGKLRELVGGRS